MQGRHQNQRFCPIGATRCTDSREIWHDKGAHGPAWPRKISRQSVHGGGKAAPTVENLYFLVKSHPAGANPFD